jgi:uncharacterized protein (DUF488 family)
MINGIDPPVIYTIGHSTHPIEYFLELLFNFKVDCLVDVRSLPASRFNSQYNKKALIDSLWRNNIRYVHCGEEFGARQTDPVLLDREGRVDFNKMRSSDKFRQGIRSLWTAVEQHMTVALMCSEGEPLHCHRFGMISPALDGFDVRHILKDKSIIGQHELENEMLKLYAKKLQPDLLRSLPSRNEKLELAYKLLNRDIAYAPARHRS